MPIDEDMPTEVEVLVMSEILVYETEVQLMKEAEEQEVAAMPSYGWAVIVGLAIVVLMIVTGLAFGLVGLLR